MIDDELMHAGPLRLVEQLAALARRRVEDEQAIADAHELRVARAESELQQRRGEISRKFEALRAAAEQPQTMQAEVLKQYDAQRASVEERLKKASGKMRRRYRQRLKAAKKKRDRIHAGETARLQKHQHAADERVLNDGELTAMRRVAMAELALSADQLLAERGIARPEKYQSPDEETFDRDNHELFAAAMKRGEAALAAMRSLQSVRLAGVLGLLFGFVGCAIASAVIAGIVRGLNAWLWISGAAIMGGIVGALVVNRAAVPLARKQTLNLWSQVRGALAAAQTAAAASFADTKGGMQEDVAAIAEKRERKLRKANAARSKEASTMKATLERKLAENAAKVAARLARMEHDRDTAIAAATGGLPQRLAQLDEQRQASLAVLDEDHARRIAACTGQRDDELEEVEADWSDALRRWETSLGVLDAWCQRRFPAWSAVGNDNSSSARRACDGVRFGEYLISPVELLAEQFPPPAPAWASAKTYAVPAMLSFHERPALLVAVPKGERLRGVDAAYNIVLRIVATLGADNVRCTILDPSSIGTRFERLARLSDIDDAIVELSTTDWQIEKALADHLEHIERVRRASGEVTEPRRVLVVLGQPAADGAAMLRQIIAQGACGGVTTLLCSDSEVRGDGTCDFHDLAPHVLSLAAVEGEFRLHNEALGPLRVTFDDPPSAAVALQLLHYSAHQTNGHIASPAYAAARR